MKRVLKRTVQGLLFLVIFFGIVVLTGTMKSANDNYYYGQYFFDALLIIIMAIALYEMISATKAGGYNPQVIPLCIILVISYPIVKLFHLLPFLAGGYHGILIFVVISILLLFLFYVFDAKVTFNNFLVSLFLLFYPILPLVVAFQLINQFGMVPLLLAVGSAMMADAFAYYFGSLIKGPKIFPKISPNKTYSGFFMGLLGGAVGAIIVYAIFELAPIPLNRIVIFSKEYKPWLFFPLIGVTLGLIGEIGDLIASRIKRCMNIKDFGKVLGSHGGIIDRLDSLIFAVVFMACFMSFTSFS